MQPGASREPVLNTEPIIAAPRRTTTAPRWASRSTSLYGNRQRTGHAGQPSWMTPLDLRRSRWRFGSRDGCSGVSRLGI
jgi:hypothetical protein